MKDMLAKIFEYQLPHSGHAPDQNESAESQSTLWKAVKGYLGLRKSPNMTEIVQKKPALAPASKSFR